MDTLLSWTFPLLRGGLGNLAAYLAAHVLLCLLPAFFIAGAMAALLADPAVILMLDPARFARVAQPLQNVIHALLRVARVILHPHPAHRLAGPATSAGDLLLRGGMLWSWLRSMSRLPISTVLCGTVNVLESTVLVCRLNWAFIRS